MAELMFLPCPYMQIGNDTLISAVRLNERKICSLIFCHDFSKCSVSSASNIVCVKHDYTL